ncbi:MAG: Nitroreductase [archaeon GW2011_AR20]|nr:MAG: Nitroreductase [archaeon GW2011_AR20]MBS3160716.1 nitroreductase family protein [Candidatus Woesearchaeota archaeon]
MNLVELLQKRYSCRKYSDKDVDDKDIGKIINHASLAPSAGNLQPWQVIVVKDKLKRYSLSVASLSQTWMKEAPVHLVICGNVNYVKKFYKVKGDLYAKQDCAAFIENILLLAADSGLSTCWVGAFDDAMVKRELSIPENVDVYAIIPLGYSNEKHPNHKKRYDPSIFTFFEKYGNRKQDKSLFPLEKQVSKIKDKSKDIFNKADELVKHSK